ncbi:MAPEG family protein [Oricola thermophila]|uniref:MAPEG family protein n=1 Tax=Oricola thermophila TaxID=2742145 RepID=A0A6N1VDG9_9HYPH|nr:MAPEG family protein [Oricola thermophila]QKV18950.1 MAPEG family protein [Oricola thermophila]
MQSNAIFWPVIVQVVLSLAMYLVMSARRIAAVKAGQAKPRDFAIPRDPEMSATAARNVSNQFELPVLFYVACLAFHQVGIVDFAALVLAWLFVAARLAHAWVHVTSNIVILRRRVFIVGYLVVALLWLWFALRLALFG